MKKILQTLFSIKNNSNKSHKILTILGIKIKFKLKSKHSQFMKEIEYRNFMIRVLQEEKDCLLKNYSNFMPIKTPNSKVYLLNDTRRTENHIGCSLVYKNILKLCKNNKMQVYFSDSSFPNSEENIGDYKSIIKYCDILLFNGEGTLHDSVGINMFEKCKYAKQLGKKVYLINTVWQNNQNVEHYLDYFDLIACRESFSFKNIPDKYKAKSIIVPDLTFYNKLNCKKDNQRKLIFTDSVIPEITDELKKIADKYHSDFYYLNFNENEDAKYLSEETLAKLQKDSLIITGRFHALTMGLKYQIPTLAYPSNTYKIQGLLCDAGLSEYCMTNFDISKSQIDKFINYNHNAFIEKSILYSENAKKQIEKLFNLIGNIN